MKTWQETNVLTTRTRSLLEGGESAAWAIVTRIEGSTYRRPGAKLLIEADGRMSGNISGGCLEADVRENALAAIEASQPRCLHYDTSDDEDTLWGMGLGCNGKVDLLVLPFQPDKDLPWLSQLAEGLAGDQPLAVRYPLHSELPTVETPTADLQTGLDDEAFTEKLLPPPTLAVIGAGDDAMPLVQMAAAVGFRVTVVDHRSAYLTAERFADAHEMLSLRSGDDFPATWRAETTLAIVKTHVLQHDQAWVERLIAHGLSYVGLLGPRDRRDAIRNRIDPEAGSRLYGPVGLDIGGEGPQQVSLSIIAEALAVWHQRTGGHLRERKTAIHDDGDEAKTI